MPVESSSKMGSIDVVFDDAFIENERAPKKQNTRDESKEISNENENEHLETPRAGLLRT